ncbi:hypothetical protein [Elizabethkingia anophelis]|uniref:hypothetical protein n=1 Tax=Elizabethkingia anophelis TaxID=1117645 RepID=UPI0038913E8C
MKKLKLKHLDLDMVEMLTKEQLKDVLGGDDDDGSGGGGFPCSTGSCQLVVKQSDGSYITYEGSCATKRIYIGKYEGFTCYCNAGGYGPMELSSNGGRSRCVSF